MKQIPLSQGLFALIDDEDYERVSKFKWTAHVARGKNNTLQYAKTAIWRDGKKYLLLMHSFISGASVRQDHADGNGLNNQKYNLRPATRRQNRANSGKTPGTICNFKGAYWKPARNKWQALIRDHGILRHLGYFKDEVDAATAYNFAALEVFGEFARYNTPKAA